MKKVLLFVCFLYNFNAAAQLQLSQSKLYEGGVNSYKTDDFKSCIQSLSKFLNHPLRNKAFEANAYYLRGMSYYKTEEYGVAIVDLRSAIYGSVFEKDNANLFLGRAFLKKDNNEEAIKAFSAIIETGRKSEIISEAYYERALVREKKGETQAALLDLKSAIEKNSNNSDAKSKLDQLQPAEAYANGRGNESKQQVTIPQNTSQNIRTNGNQNPAALYENERRYALVVGNSIYPKEIGMLKNPANDAQDIATELRKCNFDVDLLLNATHRQIEIAATGLFKKLSEGPKGQTVGLFFYAGHGLQFEGTNYLVPVDASITTPTDVVYACYPADKILGKMEFADTRMNIVILDACRSNPFPATTRSGAPQGLAQVRAAKGSYVAFATAPGSVASDGSGRNGLYTQELLKALRKPNLTIEQMFKEVRQRVSELSGGKQSTWDNSNIIGDFYFKLK
jgi:tetratricopeptide (TPR) repeat protein